MALDGDPLSISRQRGDCDGRPSPRREDLAKNPSPANPLRTRLEFFEFLASFSRQRLEVRVETQQVDWRVLANRLCHRGRRRIQCLP